MKSYHECRADDLGCGILSNFESLYKSDVRSTKVGSYLDQARNMYDDWEIKFKKQQEELKKRELAKLAT